MTCPEESQYLYCRHDSSYLFAVVICLRAPQGDDPTLLRQENLNIIIDRAYEINAYSSGSFARQIASSIAPLSFASTAHSFACWCHRSLTPLFARKRNAQRNV